MVRKEGNEWCVFSKDGNKIACHPTEKEALEQLGAIEAAKARAHEEMVRIVGFELTQEQADGIWAKVSDDEHPHSACAAMMEGKVDDPHAFCAAVEMMAAGTTPAERTAEKKEHHEGGGHDQQTHAGDGGEDSSSGGDNSERKAEAMAVAKELKGKWGDDIEYVRIETLSKGNRRVIVTAKAGGKIDRSPEGWHHVGRAVQSALEKAVGSGISLRQGRLGERNGEWAVSDWDERKQYEQPDLSNQGHHNYADLRGIEVFASGVHNGDTYTEQDLDDIVAAARELDFTPPLKAGHSEDKKGMPALGWARNLRREGAKLLADFTDMPQLVYDAIKDKRYNTVSSEVYWNLTRWAKTFRRALKAVALLGAEIPAVAGLKPLHEMFATDAEVHAGTEVRLHAAAGERTKAGEINYDKEQSIMDEKELKALTDRIDAAEKAAAEEKAKREELEKKFADAQSKAKKGSDDLDSVRRAVAGDIAEQEFRTLSAKADAAEKRATAEREAREAAEKRYEEDKSRFLKIEDDLRRDRIARVAETCRVPAIRTFVAQFLDLATRSPGVKVYDADGKEQAAAHAVEDFVKYVNANAHRLFVAHSTQDPASRRASDAGKELAEKARAYSLEHKVTYLDAMRAVVQGDPALKEAYAAEGRGVA